jgi:hypothetical protein
MQWNIMQKAEFALVLTNKTAHECLVLVMNKNNLQFEQKSIMI